MRLAHLGLGEGAEVRVDQRRPELVLQVGAARFAVERSIGRRVIVHARARGRGARTPSPGRKENVMTRMKWFVASASVAGPRRDGGAAQQQTTEAFSAGTDGSAIYKTYCAVCHGKEAQGRRAAGRRTCATRRPTSRCSRSETAGSSTPTAVHRMIDGRSPLKGHGGPDMPIWGDAFKRSGEGYSEKAVKARIEALVEHLKSLQRQ